MLVKFNIIVSQGLSGPSTTFSCENKVSDAPNEFAPAICCYVKVIIVHLPVKLLKSRCDRLVLHTHFEFWHDEN